MNFTQRLIFFIIGIAIGSVFAGYIMQQRRLAAGEEKKVAAALAPIGAEAIQRAAVPGIMQAYNQRQVPMHSEFIKNEFSIENSPQEGLSERYLILRGQEAEQVLAVYEVTETGADKVWGQLEQVRIVAADRLQVRVKADVDRAAFTAALEPLGMYVVRGLSTENMDDPSAPVKVTVEEGERWETPADVTETDLYLVGFPATEASAIPTALQAVRALDAVASADLDYLDAGDRFVRKGEG